MMSESLITKETSLPDIRLENIDWKILSVRTQRNDTRQTDPVDLVDDEVEEIVHELILQTTNNVQSKEME